MNLPATSNIAIIRRIVLLGNVVLLLVLLFTIFSSARSYLATGELAVKTNDSQTAISITQSNHDAALIGHGTARIRLHPGTYELRASLNSNTATATITIAKQHTTNITMIPSAASQLPTRQGITFSNTDALINAGLTLGQLDSLKGILFRYKPTARTITVDPNSIGHGPHDPASNDPTLSTTFTLTIDSALYDATASYAITSPNTHLILYNPNTNAVVYDSGAAN